MHESLTKLDYHVLIKSSESILFLEELADAERLPDIIISEPRLNDLPDISIFRHLRFHYPSAILVAYTSPDSEWNMQTASREGAHAFLEKGCSLHELQLTLDALKGSEINSRN
jgi:DNA-binding NarL/FixJ family response regulator